MSTTRCNFEWFSEIRGATRRRSPTAQSIPRYDGARSKNKLSIGMKRYSVLWLNAFLATLIFLSSAPTSSAAADRDRDTEREAIYKSEPVYYEPSGSYFQIVRNQTARLSGFLWAEAAEDASRMTYKGRRGRLAIVNDGALYGWILEKFGILGRGDDVKAWIGLRYMCGSRTLIWVNGEEHTRRAFSFWDVPWYQSEIRCGKEKLQFMGVYINGGTSRWRAAGSDKGYPRYLVEYPAK